MAAYIALQTCYAPEILITFFHLPFPIMGICAILLGLVLMLMGRKTRFFDSVVSRPFTVLLLWWLLDAALFTFRGYWSELFVYALRFHILLPVAICALAITLRAAGMVIWGFRIGYLVMLLVCWRFGQLSTDGRFYLPNTSMANPNDLALHLLLGMAMIAVSGFGRGFLRQAAWLVSMGAGLYFILKTGSRANMITALIAAGVAFLLFDRRRKLILATAGVLASALLVLMIPRTTWLRLTTFETISTEGYQQNPSLIGAVGSTEARKQLQIRAVKLTLAHPIFGVGPRMFQYALDDYMRNEEGQRKGSWQVPHNTYLDVSAESGLIGLALYCWVIVWCLRANYRCYRAASKVRDMEEPTRRSLNLLLTMTVYAVGTLFCSIPYTATLPTLVGLTAANWLAMRDTGILAPARRAIRA